MTGQPTWEVGSRRDLTDRSRLRETGEQNPQAARLAEQAQQIGQLDHLFAGKGAQNRCDRFRDDRLLHTCFSHRPPAAEIAHSPEPAKNLCARFDPNQTFAGAHLLTRVRMSLYSILLRS